MTKQLKPIIHGRDHCNGGADPIPCLQSPTAGDFSGVVLATTDLLAYWRLGETGEPWADTSGVGTPANLTEYDPFATGAALTPDVTGALALGDDGAVELNYNGSTAGGGQALISGNFDSHGKDFDFDGAEPAMTAAAWVKVKSSALTRRGQIIGNQGYGSGAVTGWGLQAMWPARTIRFSRGSVIDGEEYVTTSTGVVADTWYFVVGTYDGETMRLYMNAELVDTLAGGAAGITDTNDQILLGSGIYGDVDSYSWFYGTIDEAALWTRALNADEIATLYQSGVSTSSGDDVLVSDGTGGTTWGKVTPAAVEPGADGQVLTTNGTAVEWADPASSSPADDTLVWMPLTTVTGGVPELVWDGDDTLIPTLTAI